MRHCHNTRRRVLCGHRVRVRATIAAGLYLFAATLILTTYGASAPAVEIPHLTFAQLVESIRANLDVTETMKSLNGKEVEIHGFIIPAGPPDLSFFLLSRVSAMGNYCCEVPVGKDETVYVFASKGIKIAYDPLRVYKVLGAFEAGFQTDRVYGPSLFRVRNARVEEAVGMKTFKVGETSPAPSR